MARTASFDYRKTPKGWLVNIPGTVSDTGRFRRRYFKTRDEAKTECQRLREISTGTRALATDIPADLAADAIQARDMLAAFHITLAQAARFYAEHHDKRSQAPTLAAAWTAALERRANHRARYLADLKAWEKALPDSLLAMNCHDITPDDIRKALDETTDGPTRWRNGLAVLSAILGDVVKDGKLEKNPARAVHVARKASHDDDVEIYTVDELKALFAACKDYPKAKDEEDRLCAACAIPFAVMAFAGVRPDEVTRLRWEDVSLELHNIRVGAGVAKKATRRNVRINPTLAAWLETVAKDKRTGKLVPPRWRYKAARVRREAGIDGHEKQDALRHSFGTYTLATENDLDALNADMGHEHVRVFFTHYHKAMTKADALPYWQVLPPGVELPTIAALPSSSVRKTSQRRKATA
jgi:integrase